MNELHGDIIVKIAESGNFARAARELGYTQAGISYIVNTVEKELGFRLFVREYGGARLSPEGAQLLPYLRTLGNAKHQVEEKINDLRGLRCGKLRVLVFNSVSVHWLPGILREYRRDYPGVAVELVSEEDSARAEEMVFRQDVDCGFFLHEPHRNDMDVIPLIRERLLAILPPEIELQEQKFPIERLGEYPYIKMAFGEHTGISDIFRTRGIEPQVAYEMDNDYAAMAMVSAGHGFCIFPELSLRNVPFPLRIMEFSEPVSRTVSIAVRDRSTCSAAARQFMEYTHRWVGTHAQK